jgi:hypothetical protein
MLAIACAPSIFQYDYLSLLALATDMERLIGEVPSRPRTPLAIVLDIGCGKALIVSYWNHEASS